MVQMLDEVAPWKSSVADEGYLHSLVQNGLLPEKPAGEPPVWIAPRGEPEPRVPPGYVLSFARLHECGFGVPAGRFVRSLCEHYGVELQNFSPNSISQAAVFVTVCEGYLGIKPHWDLWRYLFRGELFAEGAGRDVRRPVHAGGFVLQIRAPGPRLHPLQHDHHQC